MYKFIFWNIDSLNAALTSDSARAQRIKTSKINKSGWRIDYFLASNRIKDRIVESGIVESGMMDSGMMDSGERQDHTSILLTMDL